MKNLKGTGNSFANRYPIEVEVSDNPGKVGLIKQMLINLSTLE